MNFYDIKYIYIYAFYLVSKRKARLGLRFISFFALI